MTTSQVHYLNIGLIILSVFVAFKVPFELLLFAYAVMGPLHYLTEIAWLKKKNFYAKGKHDWLVLTILTVIYVGLYIFVYLGSQESLQEFYTSIFGDVEESLSSIKYIMTDIIFVAFVVSLAMVLTKKWMHRIILAIVAIGLAFLLRDLNIYAVIFGVFIPTLLHVFVFTGLFMLYGALKEKSTVGVLSFFIFLIGAVVCLFANYGPDYFTVNLENAVELSPSVLADYFDSNFHYLNIEVLKFSDMPLETKDQAIQSIFASGYGLGIQRFAAFAFVYHYINWFSKPTVIRWHKVPKSNIIAVIVVWVICLALYWYSYKVGLLCVLIISMLHVTLEFPLNYVSIIGIGRELKKRIKK